MSRQEDEVEVREAAEPIRLQLPDGSLRECAPGVRSIDVAREIGPGLARDALAAQLDGQVLDLSRPLTRGGRFAILTFADEEGREVYRHSSAHVLAQAVKRLFPEARLAIGPPIADGFYYDFGVDEPFTPAELEAIEAEMARIVEEDHRFERIPIEREAALELFSRLGEEYKVQLVQDLPAAEPITLYRQGEFVDLCRGPHLPSTGRITAFKLTHAAGAYWRGDERNAMLQRIYGTSFQQRKALRRHLEQLEEARRRDHRRLGPKLGLFHMDEVAPGDVFWHPAGTRVFRQLLRLSRELQEPHGYQEVRTPNILKVDLWKQSGHWDHYRENMFLIQADEGDYGVKPMNCPSHCLIYRTQTRSYRDLPLRIAEYGQLARYERSGALHGIMRVRGFLQDDAHLFVRPDQIKDEVVHVLGLVEEIYEIFAMPFKVRLATRPAKAMGDGPLWERAEAALRQALEAAGRDYEVAPGEGAFYGPKLDFDVTDSLGRQWQCATVQLDFQFPQRFDLTYMDEHGEKRRPVMIHRALMGSLERFIGILIEHFDGAFPTWLAPTQVVVVPITDDHQQYAGQVAQELAAQEVRVQVDDRSEKVSYKIREAEVKRVPYMLVVGDREEAAGSVAVRRRGDGDQGALPREAFVAQLLAEIRERRAPE